MKINIKKNKRNGEKEIQLQQTPNMKAKLQRRDLWRIIREHRNKQKNSNGEKGVHQQEKSF